MQTPSDESLRRRQLDELSQRIAQLREEIASLEGVLEGFPTPEQSAHAQQLVGHLRNATIRNELAVRQTELTDLNRRVAALGDVVEQPAAAAPPPGTAPHRHAVVPAESTPPATPAPSQSDPDGEATLAMEPAGEVEAETLQLAPDAGPAPAAVVAPAGTPVEVVGRQSLQVPESSEETLEVPPSIQEQREEEVTPHELAAASLEPVAPEAAAAASVANGGEQPQDLEPAMAAVAPAEAVEVDVPTITDVVEPEAPPTSVGELETERDGEQTLTDAGPPQPQFAPAGATWPVVATVSDSPVPATTATQPPQPVVPPPPTWPIDQPAPETSQGRPAAETMPAILAEAPATPEPIPAPQAAGPRKRRSTLMPVALAAGAVVVVGLGIGAGLLLGGGRSEAPAAVPTRTAPGLVSDTTPVAPRATPTVQPPTRVPPTPVPTAVPTDVPAAEPVVLAAEFEPEPEVADEPAPALPTGTIQAPGFASVNLRRTPSSSAPSIRAVPVGTRVDIMAGRATADGLTWQQVRTPEGDEGWVSAGVIAR